MFHENNRNNPTTRCFSLQQLTILQYIEQGLTSAEIANKLGTPQKTVVRQIRRIDLLSPFGGVVKD